MSDKFEPREFIMYTNAEKRAGETSDLLAFLKSLPHEVFHVLVKKRGESRTLKANRLYNALLGEVAEQHTQFSDPSVIAGASKYHLLLQRKKIWAAEEKDEHVSHELQKSYEFESRLCESIVNSNQFNKFAFVDEDGLMDHDAYLSALYRGYDYAIRSKTLPPKYFKKYVDVVIDTWTDKGFEFDMKANKQDQERYEETTA